MLRGMALLALAGLGCAIGSPAYRACAPGNAPACMQAGAELENEGSNDFAFRSYATACDDGVLEGCLKAIAAQPAAFDSMFVVIEGRNAEVLTKACELGSDEQCLNGVWPQQAHNLELVCRRTPGTCSEVLEKMDHGTCCFGSPEERAARQAEVAPLGGELAWIGCDAVVTECVPAARMKWLDTAMRIRLYARACDANEGAACTAQAQLLPEKDPQVRVLYARACQLKDTDGCTELGRLVR